MGRREGPPSRSEPWRFPSWGLKNPSLDIDFGQILPEQALTQAQLLTRLQNVCAPLGVTATIPEFTNVAIQGTARGLRYTVSGGAETLGLQFNRRSLLNSEQYIEGELVTPAGGTAENAALMIGSLAATPWLRAFTTQRDTTSLIQIDDNGGTRFSYSGANGAAGQRHFYRMWLACRSEAMFARWEIFPRLHSSRHWTRALKGVASVIGTKALFVRLNSNDPAAGRLNFLRRYQAKWYTEGGLS